jgi:hypothetical protein
MKTQLFFAIVISLGGMVFSPSPTLANSKYIAGDDDHLPWPWGTECPFPWTDIQGVWRAYAPNMEDGRANDTVAYGYYEFKVTSEWTNGTKVIEIVKYSAGGKVEGKGQGYSHPEQRIVRAIILGEAGSRLDNHRVIVRAYHRDTTLTCGGELVTVLTTRPVSDDEGNDRHYVLKKVPVEL